MIPTTQKMITIDGSKGEGGGAVVRTAIALSALTGRPIRIINIRAGRSNPGLRAQHLNAIKAVAMLCTAKVRGLNLGSKEIEFSPDKIKHGKLNVDIGTAGSITLVLQSLMIPASFAEKDVKIEVRGGTDVRWSPPIDYLRFVTVPIMEKFGLNVKIDLLRRGYYPKGGGIVRVDIRPIERLKRINLVERGEIKCINGISHAHIGLKERKVAERQANSARKDLFKLDYDLKIKKEYVDTLSYGSGITLWAETKNSVIGADSLGERGKRAEVVGQEAALGILEEIQSNDPIDKYMGDQIIPYLALASGRVKVSEITRHTTTNVDIANEFGFNLKIKEDIIES